MRGEEIGRGERTPSVSFDGRYSLLTRFAKSKNRLASSGEG